MLVRNLIDFYFGFVGFFFYRIVECRKGFRMIYISSCLLLCCLYYLFVFLRSSFFLSFCSTFYFKCQDVCVVCDCSPINFMVECECLMCLCDPWNFNAFYKSIQVLRRISVCLLWSARCVCLVVFFLLYFGCVFLLYL